MKIQKVIFELSMPNVGSWNGKWSGSKDKYTVQESLRSEDQELIGKSFYYNFGDGWGANVSVRLPEPKEKPTNRFCGYEWMINSILKNRRITIQADNNDN